MSPPTKPARSDEIKRVSAPDAPGVQNSAVGIAKYLFCGFALAEAIVLLIQLLTPMSALLVRIPPVFHSAFATDAPLRLTPVTALSCVLGTLGGLGRMWCHRTLGQFFTWEIAIRDGHKLVKTGPYSIVRHPSYTSWYPLAAGNVMLLLSRGSFFRESGLTDTIVGKVVACYLIGYMGWLCVVVAPHRVVMEDQLLQERFGAEWEEWAKKTRYRLIPFVY